MKRFLPDLAFAVAAFLTAWLLAATLPRVRSEFPVAVKASTKVSQIKPATGRAPVKPDAKTSGGAVKERNIFAASGRYGESTTKETKDPVYSLIGIIREGKERKGLFRDDAGAVTRAGRGESLADGFKIGSVSAYDVVLKREDRTKTMRLFDAQSPVDPRRAEKKGLHEPVLVGILGGKERKVLFRDEEGALVIYDRGQRLPNGALILRVGDRSVTIRVKGKPRELTLNHNYTADQPTHAAAETSPSRPIPGRRLPPRSPNRVPPAAAPPEGGA